MPSQVDIHLVLTPSPADDVDVLAFDLVRWKRRCRIRRYRRDVAQRPVAVVFADVRGPALTCSGPEVEDDWYDLFFHPVSYTHLTLPTILRV